MEEKVGKQNRTWNSDNASFLFFCSSSFLLSFATDWWTSLPFELFELFPQEANVPVLSCPPVACMYYVLCPMYYVLCIMFYILCPIYYVLYIMSHILCTMSYILCPIYYVPCTMHPCFVIRALKWRSQPIKFAIRSSGSQNAD